MDAVTIERLHLVTDRYINSSLTVINMNVHLAFAGIVQLGIRGNLLAGKRKSHATFQTIWLLTIELPARIHLSLARGVKLLKRGWCVGQRLSGVSHCDTLRVNSRLCPLRGVDLRRRDMHFLCVGAGRCLP